MPRRYVVAVAAGWLFAAGPTVPGPLLAPRPARPSPIVPAILGTWQAGPVWAVDRATHQLHLDQSPVDPELSDRNLMPCGQRIQLSSGYDKVSDVAYWQITWLVPYPPNSCQYPFLQFQCSEIDGVNQPRQKSQSLEFTMDINRGDLDSFFPVGASETGRVYYLRCGNNGEWEPEFYVSKDGQTMWSAVGIGFADEYKQYYGLQEYHRLADYKRP